MFTADQSWYDLYDFLKLKLAPSKFLNRFTTVPKFMGTQHVLIDYISPLRCVGNFCLLEQLWKAYDVMRLSEIVPSVLLHSTDERICIEGLSNDIVKMFVGRGSTVSIILILPKVQLFVVWPLLPLPAHSSTTEIKTKVFSFMLIYHFFTPVIMCGITTNRAVTAFSLIRVVLQSFCVLSHNLNACSRIRYAAQSATCLQNLYLRYRLVIKSRRTHFLSSFSPQILQTLIVKFSVPLAFPDSPLLRPSLLNSHIAQHLEKQECPNPFLSGPKKPGHSDALFKSSSPRPASFHVERLLSRLISRCSYNFLNTYFPPSVPLLFAFSYVHSCVFFDTSFFIFICVFLHLCSHAVDNTLLDGSFSYTSLFSHNYVSAFALLFNTMRYSYYPIQSLYHNFCFRSTQCSPPVDKYRTT